MPIKNYTTKVEAIRSVAEICECLAQSGASMIRQEYEAGRPVGISFLIATPCGMRGFRIPVSVEKLAELLKKQNVKADAKQVQNIAWRNVRDWVYAQMALLETEMVSLDEVFLPYMIDSEGSTVYDRYVQRQLLLE